ncbi:MAG: ribosome biogenesis GTP-binding protein YihA/YsxC [Lachnospiraceae bacterium]|nr:ribosome biogenesis GTP-binding protein YihA/YsxC [Lachnospiraceae bacterium]
MIIKSAELETVVGVTTKGLPQNKHPEFAFAGRSNVGKSSLINSLMSRKNLARTSSTPGKTQTMNFYNINKELYFVDLPGYGYAKVKVDFKAQWGPMIERYLKGSKSLRAVFILVDMRRPPTDDDMMMYEWVVKAGFNPIIIATKSDKLKRSQVKGALAAIEAAFKGEKVRIIPFSALKGTGRDEILKCIDELLITDAEENKEDMKK